MKTYFKIRKYLLFLAIFFSLLLWVHIAYVYLYSWADKFPVEWWSISVWFIWDMPSVNPLEFSTNPSNDYILQFLYKSLLRYDPSTRQMEWDLANCDLWKDFGRIKCYLKNEYSWSDGTPITKEDVLTTYNTIKNSDINNQMKSMLNNIDITDKWDYIEFSSKNADVLLLDSFTIPVVKKDQVNDFLEKKSFEPITSWDYIFWTKEYDEKFGIKKISIFKRENSKNSESYISKYNFKFFGDANSLLKNEDSLNIIFNDNSEKVIVSPRFEEYKYILHQYIWLFLNIEKISSLDLRKFIIFSLNNGKYEDILSINKWEKINNPFFSDEVISPEITNKNLWNILNLNGFFKKDALIGEINKKYEELLKPKKTDVEIPYSWFFTTPSARKIYFHWWGDEVLLSWNVPSWVEEVWIDDYKLGSFVPGNTKFYFRAKTEYKTLNIWANYYTLYFVIWWKKIKKEVYTIYYYTKKEDLENKKKEVEESLGKSEELTEEQKNKINSEKNEELKKINELDNMFFYDKNLNKFKLKLAFAQNGKIFIDIANKIKEELKILWIDVELEPIDQAKMEDMVKKWNKDYDMILNWINHWLYYYNIYPFFHSWQAKVGFNFSKIKDISLDLLLEKLKSSTINKDLLKQIEKETLVVLKREAVVKTFYSPYQKVYIDKNIKNQNKYDIFPYSYNTYEIIKNSYIKEDWVIDFNKKSLDNFFMWIKKYL